MSADDKLGTVTPQQDQETVKPFDHHAPTPPTAAVEGGPVKPLDHHAPIASEQQADASVQPVETFDHHAPTPPTSAIEGGPVKPLDHHAPIAPEQQADASVQPGQIQSKDQHAQSEPAKPLDEFRSGGAV